MKANFLGKWLHNSLLETALCALVTSQFIITKSMGYTDLIFNSHGSSMSNLRQFESGHAWEDRSIKIS